MKISNEVVVLVDKFGKPTGEILPKLDAHHENTPFHLGFSCYVFNDEGKLLVTKRAKTKKVWPEVWTNSVCGHPGPDESVENAIKRRLDFELGMTAKNFKLVLPDYSYTTPPFKGIIENEYCPVYFAIKKTFSKPNPNEVDDIKWMTWDEFVNAASKDKDDVYSYWCKDQLKQLKKLDILSEYTH